MGYTITPKEGVGRSNRLGDANKIKGLQPTSCNPFLYIPLKLYFSCTFCA